MFDTPVTKKLKIEVPVQGWKQFLASRKEMLDAFDRAREKAKIHEVEVYHGKVAEAELRKWLLSFLPKRYGITSGYIVSPGLRSNQKTPHFDLIIYDQLESPILWVEDHPDVSQQGCSRAIPVEYVRCVLEVKANFTSKTVAHAIKHLKDLLPLMNAHDDAQERYKLYLPVNFCCGVVFFELKKENQSHKAALSKMIEGKDLRGFLGGIILRGEDHKRPFTGKLSLHFSDIPIEDTLRKRASLLQQASMTKFVKFADNYYHGAILTWAEPIFSEFGFDLISRMQGKYEAGRLSSFHGIGSSEWE